MTALRERPPEGMATAADQVERQPIRVMFCCDPGYYQHLAVALASLLENNRRHPLEVIIVSSAADVAAESRLLGTLPTHPDAKIIIRYFSLDRFRALPTSFHITLEAYLRILIIDVLPSGIDKILYLDCDLVVIDDLGSLWETDVRGYALAAVPDPYGSDRPHKLGMPEGAPYVNSGVLLLNVRRWHEQGLVSQIIDYANRMGSGLEYHDQDAINALLYTEIRTLPFRWNCQARMFWPRQSVPKSDRSAIMAAICNPAIIHYTTAQKPWMFTAFMPQRAVYHRYLALTGWRGTPSARKSLVHLPEATFNGTAYALGFHYTFDRFLRRTTVGRVLARGGKLIRQAALTVTRRAITTTQNSRQL